MRWIPLTQGKRTVVDSEDFEWLSSYTWAAAKRIKGKHIRWEARAKVLGRDVTMHRLIMREPKGKWVDHKDGDGLNNQRNNLRICTPLGSAQNCRIRQDNKSGFKGLGWMKRLGKWQVVIQCNGRSHYIGLFDDKVKAAKAYDTAAQKLFGEFARTNASLGLI